MKRITHSWQSLLLLLLWVIAVSCQKQDPSSPSKKEMQFALSGFSKIIAGENFTVNIIRSNEFGIKVIGAADDLGDLGISVNQGILTLKYNRLKLNRDKIEFTITLPVIDMVQLLGGAKGNIAGFQDQQLSMRAILSDISNASIFGAGTHLSINVSGNSALSLSGTAVELQGKLSGSAVLHAYGLNTKDANVSAGENAKVYISASNVLFANVTGNGRVYYKGDPSMHVEVYENGMVIRE